MKSKLIVLTLLLYLCSNVYSQEKKELKHVRDSIDKLTRLAVNSYAYDTLIIPNEAVKKYFKKKSSGYLFGSEDISYFNNYASINTTNGEASIGFNFSWQNVDIIQERISKKTDPALSILKQLIKTQKLKTSTNHISLGLKTKQKDNYAKFFADNNLTNLGFEFSFKHVFNGRIWYIGEKKSDKLIKQLSVIRAEVVQKMRIDLAERHFFCEEIRDSAIRDEYINEFYKDATATYLSNFNDKILEKIEEADFKPKSTIFWFDANVYLPFFLTEYKTLQNDIVSSNIESHTHYLFSLGASINGAVEGPKYSIIFNAGGKFGYHNTITLDQIKKMDIENYIGAGGADSSRMTTIDNEKVYHGAFNALWVPSTYLRFVIMRNIKLKKKTYGKIGGSLYVEKFINHDYSPLNIQVGIPILLIDKKGKNKVKFEIQAKINDFNADKIKEDAIRDNIILGIAIGVPFGNIKK